MDKRCKTLKLNISNNPLIIVGDVHGDLNVLIEPFKKFLYLKNNGLNPYLIYLGDYIDRGDNNGYISYLITILHKKFPNNIFFIIGNHDDAYYRITGDHEGFYDVNIDWRRFKIPESKQRTMHSFFQSYIYELITKIGHYQILINDRYILSHLPVETYYDKIDINARKYINIHGHDHKGNSFEDIKRLKKDISLDFDMSYGFKLFQNCVDNKTILTSDVIYVILQEDTVEIEQNIIKFTDFKNNYNMKSLKNICTELDILEYFDIQEFKNIIENCFKNEFKDKNIKEYRKNIKLFKEELYKNKVIFTYNNFDFTDNCAVYDIPSEFYTDNFIPVHVNFWKNIIGDESIIDELYNVQNGKINDTLNGGHFKNNHYNTIIITILTILLVFIILIVIIIIIQKRCGFNKFVRTNCN